MTRPVVIVIRSIPIPRDSRAERMIADYAGAGYQVEQLFWSRGEDIPAPPGVFVFRGRGRYGARWVNVGSLLRWYVFLARTLWDRRRTIQIVHSVDMDCGLVAVPLARLMRKRVVYDAYDQLAAGMKAGWARLIFAMVERQLLRAADIIIFPDKSRLEQYGVIGQRNALIISNVPSADALPTGERHSSTSPVEKARLTLCYVGTLEPVHRGLEYLLDLCRADPEIECIVAGNGPLEPEFQRASADLLNFHFKGRVDYSVAVELMRSADVLYGPYLLTTSAHHYAAPNKLYEHLALGRPLITNEGGPPGAFIEVNRTGFVFDGSVKGLIRLMTSLDRRVCRQVGRRAALKWEGEYKSLRSRQVNDFLAVLSKELQ